MPLGGELLAPTILCAVGGATPRMFIDCDGNADVGKVRQFCVQVRCWPRGGDKHLFA